jgi:hypothetical protein
MRQPAAQKLHVALPDCEKHGGGLWDTIAAWLLLGSEASPLPG